MKTKDYGRRCNGSKKGYKKWKKKKDFLPIVPGECGDEDMYELPVYIQEPSCAQGQDHQLTVQE